MRTLRAYCALAALLAVPVSGAEPERGSSTSQTDRTALPTHGSVTITSRLPRFPDLAVYLDASAEHRADCKAFVQPKRYVEGGRAAPTPASHRCFHLQLNPHDVAAQTVAAQLSDPAYSQTRTLRRAVSQLRTPVSEAAVSLELAVELARSLADRDYGKASELDARAAALPCAALCGSLARLRGELRLDRYDAAGAARFYEESLFLLGHEASADSNERVVSWQRAGTRADLAFALALDVVLARGLDETGLARGSVEANQVEARRQILVAIDEAEALGEADLVAHVTARLAAVEIAIGDAAAAIAATRIAEQTYSELGDEYQSLEAVSNRALYWSWQGRYDEARLDYQRALARARAAGFDDVEGQTLGNLARLHALFGDHARASSYRLAALQLEERMGRQAQSMGIRIERVRSLRALGEFDEAASEAQTALRYFSRREDRALELDAFVEVAANAAADGACPSVVEQLESRLSDLLEIEDSDLQRRFLAVRAECALRGGDVESVLADLRGAQLEAANREQPDPLDVALSLRLLDALAVAGDADEAIAIGLRTIDAVETIRNRLDASRLGPAWAGFTAPIFQRTASLLLDRHYATGDVQALHDAFELLESARGRSLWSQREASAFQHRAATGEVARDAHQLGRLADLAATTAAAFDPERDGRSELLERLSRYHRQTATVLAASLEPVQPLSRLLLADLQAKLEDDESVLMLFCEDAGRCHALILDQHDLAAWPLETTARLQQSAERVRASLSSRASTASWQLDRLREQLSVNAWRSHLGDRVFLTIDAPLDEVPLEMLLDEPGSERAPTDLGADTSTREVLRVSTLRALVAPRTRPKQYLRKIAIFADPAFEVASTQHGGRARDGDALRWARLEGTAREAQAVASLYEDADTLVRVGSAATPSALLSPDMLGARILHIASHAYRAPGARGLVGIATAPESPGGSPGLVTDDLLLGHRVDAELVVIAACDSGAGRSYWGEGRMSLARMFIGQGAGQVVSTLWPISDSASARFMELFHEALTRDNTSPAQALRLAKRVLRREPRHRHPYFWAPFVLHAGARPSGASFSRTVQ